jgi:hypothetical protein
MPQNGITGTYDSASGVLTLSGTASVANYQTALRSIGFYSTSNNPTVPTPYRTVTWLVNDGSATQNISSPATSGITIIATNNAPLALAGGSINYTENTAAAPIDTGITLSDIDNTDFVSATITVSSGFTAGDSLSFSNQNGIIGSYNSNTGVLTLNGLSSVSNYQAALRSITYMSTSDHPTALSSNRTVTWVVNDGMATNNLSSAVTSTIVVTPINDAPSATAGSSVTYLENAVPLSIDTALVVTDPDNANLNNRHLDSHGLCHAGKIPDGIAQHHFPFHIGQSHHHRCFAHGVVGCG